MLVYVLWVSKGSWDDYDHNFAGIYDCPFKAEEAKQKLKAKYEKDKSSSRFDKRRIAQNINEILVKEVELNTAPQSPFI